MACEEEFARMIDLPVGSDARDQAKADFYESRQYNDGPVIGGDTEVQDKVA
jgi:hypothetical protein